MYHSLSWKFQEGSPFFGGYYPKVAGDNNDTYITSVQREISQCKE